MLRTTNKTGKTTGRPNGSAAVAKQRLLGALEFDRLQCERGSDAHATEKLAVAR